MRCFTLEIVYFFPKTSLKLSTEIQTNLKTLGMKFVPKERISCTKCEERNASFIFVS